MTYRIEKNYDVDYPEFSIFEKCEIDGDYPDAVVAEDGEQFFDTLEDAQIALKELEKVANKEQALKAIEDLLSDPDQVSYGNGVGTDGSLYPDVKIGLEMALKLLDYDFYDAAQLNYHLDHVIAEKLNISLEDLDALPLSEVDKLRLEEITT